MAKLTLTDVVASQVSTQNALNGNFKSIEKELNDNVLYRNNPAGEPNFLETPLDMNSQRILNLPTPQSQSDAVRLADIPSSTEQVSAVLVEVKDEAGKLTGETAEAVFEELFDDKMAKGANLGDVASTSASRSNLGVEIGVDVQAWNQNLDDISALPVTDGNFIVGDGTNWVVEGGATVRTSLGLGSAAVATVLDEDDFISNSANDVPSQQSVKSYVDTTPLQKPGTSIDPGLAFNTWRTPNTDRPVMVQVRANVSTDGTTSAIIELDVDESGGTSPDYNLAAIAHNGLPANARIYEMITVMIPAGGSYQLNNLSDPNGINVVEFHREFTL